MTWSEEGYAKFTKSNEEPYSTVICSYTDTKIVNDDDCKFYY
jgi:hypothetical protein